MPPIGLSTHAENGIVAAMIRAAAAAYVLKVAPLDQLLETIRQLGQRRAAGR